MNSRTEHIDFLEPADAFLAQFESVTPFARNRAWLASAPDEGALHVLHLAPPPG